MVFAVDETDFFGWVWDALNELDQVELIGVCGVSAECMGFGPHRIFVLVDAYRALALLAVLNRATGRANGLVTDKDNIGVGTRQKRSQIIHDPPPGAHATASDDDCRFA